MLIAAGLKYEVAASLHLSGLLFMIVIPQRHANERESGGG